MFITIRVTSSKSSTNTSSSKGFKAQVLFHKIFQRIDDSLVLVNASKDYYERIENNIDNGGIMNRLNFRLLILFYFIICINA